MEAHNLSGYAIKNKQRLLREAMRALAGDARMSFEGDLDGLKIQALAGASLEETPMLKRATAWPEKQFIVVPLEAATIPLILAGIGGTVSQRVLHIQIEKAGTLQFAAYDNFDPACVVVGPDLQCGFLNDLVTRGILQRRA